MPLENFTGLRFGRWTVVGRDLTRPKPTKWLCNCDCGSGGSVVASVLKSGQSRSCGCLRRELSSERRRTHGGSRTRLYGIWTGMHRRCTDPNLKNYRYYGGSGVRVEDGFAVFEDFAAWAAESGYAEHLTLDRRDGAGNYSPDNCRWSTRSEQSSNRTNVARTGDGTPWFVIAERNGIGKANYLSRVQRGWAHERAATKPLTRRRNHANAL